MLPLVVVKGNRPSLFGRDWLAHLKLDWKGIHLLNSSPLKELLSCHRKLFEDGLGTLRGYKPKLYVCRSQCGAKFCKARPVPYAMRSEVEKELK